MVKERGFSCLIAPSHGGVGSGYSGECLELGVGFRETVTENIKEVVIESKKWERKSGNKYIGSGSLTKGLDC